MSSLDERRIDPVSEMTRIAINILDVRSRGFEESFRSTKPGKVIYDSDKCRVSLIWGGWDYGTGNSLHIRYGRLHALNEQSTRIWQDEECHCWHRVEYAMHFLDNHTPAETARLKYSHPFLSPFREEEYQKRFDRRQPEWLAQIHVAIWQHYGQRLFDLFDLHHPELWQQYRQFLEKVYDIEGRKPRIQPPLDKVC